MVALLCACSGTPQATGNTKNAGQTPDIDAARKASFPDNPFKEHLRTGYIELADYEWRNNNRESAKRFGRKAMTTITNLDPDMEGLYDRDLPLEKLNNLLGAKYYVEMANVAGFKTKHPEDAAIAQLMFDCWVEQSTKSHPADDKRPCKAEFDRINGNIATFMAEANQQNDEKKEAIEAKVEKMKSSTEAETPWENMPEHSLIFFKYNSTELGITAESIIEKVASDIHKFKPKKVIIAGNADLTGSYDYNMRLAMRRGQAVADLMIKKYGTDVGLLDVKAYGFNNPRFGENIKRKDVRNRYVKIIFMNKNKTYYDDNNNGQ
jgi:OOP family OmpA-OmpF porin